MAWYNQTYFYNIIYYNQRTNECITTFNHNYMNQLQLPFSCLSNEAKDWPK